MRKFKTPDEFAEFIKDKADKLAMRRLRERERVYSRVG